MCLFGESFMCSFVYGPSFGQPDNMRYRGDAGHTYSYFCNFSFRIYSIYMYINYVAISLNKKVDRGYIYIGKLPKATVKMVSKIYHP